MFIDSVRVYKIIILIWVGAHARAWVRVYAVLVYVCLCECVWVNNNNFIWFCESINTSIIVYTRVWGRNATNLYIRVQHNWNHYKILALLNKHVKVEKSDTQKTFIPIYAFGTMSNEIESWNYILEKDIGRQDFA